MKFLIFSDSHKATLNMMSVIDRQTEAMDGIIHLGDCAEDAELLAQCYPNASVYSVSGNCDFGASLFGGAPEERIINADGFRILLVHGHNQGVKSGTARLESYARMRGVDAVLFGHTHEKCDYCSVDDDGKRLYVFNPGSVSRPSSGEPSFGLLTVVGGQLLLSHGDVYSRKS